MSWYPAHHIVRFLIIACASEPSKAHHVFLPATEFAAGGLSRSVVAGDFNLDDNQDLAVTFFGPDHDGGGAAVLLGNGDGSFGPPLVLDASFYAPRSIAVGDFNMDGRPDLAVAGSPGGILLGNGDGTFGGATPSLGGDRGVATGDLNRDEFLDLVAASYVAGQVTVTLGNGDGTFAFPTYIPTGHALDTSVGDLNEDGLTDLVVACPSEGVVSVFLGKGDGTFHTKQDCPTAGAPYEVAIADLSDDGHADLAVANYFNVAVVLGTGEGSFGAPTTFDTGEYVSSVAAGDLTGEGRPEILAGNAYSNTVSELVAGGFGTFWPTEDYSVGITPRSVAVADLDNDGLLDAVAATTYTVSVLLRVRGSVDAGYVSPESSLRLSLLGASRSDALQFQFSLPRASGGELSVFDVRGRRLGLLARGTFAAGTHVVEWPTQGPVGILPRGVYVARLRTDTASTSLKFAVTK
jgi:hypothetical protein